MVTRVILTPAGSTILLDKDDRILYWEKADGKEMSANVGYVFGGLTPIADELVCGAVSSTTGTSACPHVISKTHYCYFCNVHKIESAVPKPKVCTCDIVLLTQEGCSCGAIERYRPA